ncbi:hypothetical protein POG77_10625 [Lactococcus petauri]|uniref:hypothetical protein n=1 Tax=Lactococcus petauri TaxID=1940789 RepID=UPI00232ED1B2|nr:hypothetical protein [Lactococcus petauri]MDC0816069.1 hypothetical protein [Lactococcus petauri]MDC0818129.1 hypothetical protein [Lactococcus petauri]MDC0824841.1 hypothetical protein [Lactococcus petauri]MDC0831364.1 hypothetical protein [Lactococcus petauri]
MVDRSYSPYESIRNYHDRGMMKWSAFATGELVEAQKKYTEEQLIEDSIDKRYRESYDEEW